MRTIDHRTRGRFARAMTYAAGVFAALTVASAYPPPASPSNDGSATAFAAAMIAHHQGASDMAQADYRVAGTPLVWMIDAAERTATVIAIDESTVTLGVHDALSGGDVVPCFTCVVGELFEGLAPAATN